MKSAIMIAATGSGCGKTTITCALLAAYKKLLLKTRAFKCGPDYIDPMFHKTVIGVESENLDLFFSTKKQVKQQFYADNYSDISIVEGVMGLYDGINPMSDEGSSYDLACALNIPIVLVVNASGMGRSILAQISGYKIMDSENRVKGVILNNISKQYFDAIKPVIEGELGIKVFGYYPKRREGTFESRYLGLKLPAEIDDIKERVNAAAEIIKETVDLDAVFNEGILETDEAALYSIRNSTEYNGDKIRIAVSRDEAFCFQYTENLRMLKKYGAELVEFSPLHDETLPKNISGFILYGGYPELYADKLSANISMRQSIKNAVEKGIPSIAECGGFMYLHKSLAVDGIDYPMVGVIDGQCNKKDHLVRFGYISIEENRRYSFLSKDDCIKGHEFHYYDSTDNGIDAISYKPDRKRNWESCHIDEKHWWGFAHLYYLSNEGFVNSFIEKCKLYSKTL